ncbi:hypothetical protein K435DRAFT_803445 [Dendrothele bispora CBS 962.96]|uniref:Uncharacterized protein n=1 Tax=Dendrothele bispora (strain CBS 962.96) TaxID=1314807 RepID=A0A4S8LHH9_DENBC|nr:hypothetical protein K435DRAFT_803445 [Dendrothele bispora CBS 962.96]
MMILMMATLNLILRRSYKILASTIPITKNSVQPPQQTSCSEWKHKILTSQQSQHPMCTRTIPNSRYYRDLLQQPPFSVESGGTYTSAFVVDTGQSNTSKISLTDSSFNKNLLLPTESYNTDTGDKLPWRNLFEILRERKCQFENWLEDTPQPHTQNGIEKAPQREIKAVYKALLDRERPSRICRIDGSSGGADLRFILQDPPGSGE